MAWTPHVTVAAVVRRADRYLLVEEAPDGHAVLNQPAGHLEAGESLLEAAVREVIEETGYDFVPTALIGIYQWQVPRSDRTYLRFCFCGDVTGPNERRERDPEIHAVHWLTRDEIRSGALPPRSPLVLRCIDDAISREPLPLNHLVHVAPDAP
jgi:8-oxo-dGTP pyrophosphatase MutT (NUDIX family)